MKLPSLNPFSKENSQQYIAIDLGSSNVRVSIFQPATELESIKVLGTGTQPQGRHAMNAGLVEDFDLVLDTIASALDEAAIKADAAPEQVIFGLSGSMVQARGLKVRTKRSDPEKNLDEKEFDVLADHIEDQTLEKVRSELQERFGSELTRVETNFTAYAMDGAKVDTPLGLPGEELEIAVLHYFMDTAKLRVINNMADQLDIEIVAVVNSVVNYAVHKIDENPSFVVVDIGGDISEVVVIEDGKVLANEVLLMGGSDITWQIQRDLNVDIDEAERLKFSYAQGSVDNDKGYLIRQSVEQFLNALSEGVAMALSQIDPKTIPSHFIITGETRHLSEVKSSLESYPWTQSFHIENQPQIHIAEGRLPTLESLTNISFS